MASRALVLGTRGSALALQQARYIGARLERVGFRVALEEIATTGDLRLDVPLSSVGEKGLFTKEIDLALLEGRIQVAVHSLKDLPTDLDDGIFLAAVTEREDPRDAFVAHPDEPRGLTDLPTGSILATSALRRTAQLKAWRPDLQIVPVRGNVDTRLRKLASSDWHGLILAYAGLSRLGLDGHIREIIDTDIVLPAVGQGSLGVVCASEDRETYAILHDVLHDVSSGSATTAERSFLRSLEGGCAVPIGAHGQVREDRLLLEGAVVSLDGSRRCRDAVVGHVDEAEMLGLDLAARLREQGADQILDEIRASEK